MLFGSETLFEVWCVESHKLAHCFETDAMTNIIHAFLVSNDVVIEGFQTRNLCHHVVTVAGSLDNGVV